MVVVQVAVMMVRPVVSVEVERIVHYHVVVVVLQLVQLFLLLFQLI